MTPNDPIRATLAPLIRAAGVRPTAEKLGVSDAALHRWMAGHNAISDSRLGKLAGLFGFALVVSRELRRA